ncbi:MAG: hypothetical protein E6G94_12990 [Alphaproteobacteria bacterium]|nr:MAG: hypothetical protein E6G94_12990 [Alphaproteobacteria bacterium]
MSSTLVDTVLAIAVLAAFALIAGGLWLILNKRDPKRGLLMILAAAVTLANVVVWNLPAPSDQRIGQEGSSRKSR